MDVRFFLGVLGAVLLVAGAATLSVHRKHTLFALGNACMFVYALLGYLAGGPIFFLILQIFVAVSTVCMVLRVPDAYDTPILAIVGGALVLWSLSLFQGPGTALFVVGLAVLGIGFAMNAGTARREIALFLGSVIIALFSFLMRDWIFTVLNVLFAGFSLRNLWRVKAQG